MATEPLWRGVAAALVTLFDSAGEVDCAATAAHAKRLVDHGIRAVLVAGTTGEADSLTEDERVALVSAVRQAVPAGIPVLAGASGAWAGAASTRAAAAIEAGADAVLVAPPRRCHDVPAFYGALPRSRPVLAYHFPGVAGGEVPVEALGQLPIAGLKDSTGDAGRLLRELAAWDGWTYVGSTTMALLAGALGAPGAILAVANAFPEDCVAAFGGDGAAQRRLLGPHLEAQRSLKALVASRFGTSTVARIG